MHLNKNQSAKNLKSFAAKQNTTSNNSVITFDAKVLIKTALVSNQIEDIEIMISFVNSDRLGKLEFFKSDLDPYFYPTQFYPDYDSFSIIDNFLRIEGTHTKNINIGDYEVDIIPL